MSLFKRDAGGNDYFAVIDGIEFICEVVKPEFEEAAPALVKAYQEKLPRIAEHLLDEVTAMFGPITTSELTDALGPPQIDLDRGTLSFLEHTLDDDHVIEVEYSGLFDELYDVTIDG